MNRSWKPLFAAGLFAACLGTGPVCAAGPPAERPNIVLAIADDWGWPYAGAYGDRVVQTPTFDRLARDGVLFTHAFVSSPSCTPSRGAIITGQHFWRLGAGANLHSIWPQGQFAEYPALLSQAGYHVGTYRKAWGPGRGNPGGKPYKSVAAFFEARPAGSPFCFWFGSSDPHRPFDLDSGARSGMNLADVHLFPQYPDVPTSRGDVADYCLEIQRFDRELGELIEYLERSGELERTLVVVTGDHGMPFPRGKGNVYDCGARVPLVARLGGQVPGGRTVDDLVSLADLAPTFLEAAGVAVPEEMTGRSLWPILRTDRSGRVDPAREYVLIGRERHTQSQEAPDRGGYPVRAVRTYDHLYVHNLRPDRWPAGTPDWQRAFFERAWLSDCDNGPTKRYLWDHRDEPAIRPLYELCFAKRPAEELYELASDPDQMRNRADDPQLAAVKTRLAELLDAQLRATNDPRLSGGGDALEAHPYLGGGGGQWLKDE
ncbi:MAG: sulfatase [Pirellulales bacterium]|nr:sulfatase [Pirellulales bacterium]